MRKRSHLQIRLTLLAGSAAYIAAFVWGYHHFLANAWSYWGFADVPVPAGLQAIAISLAFVPALWLPSRFTEPTHFLYWALYLVVYVPSILVPLFANVNGRPILPLMLTFAAALAIIGAFYRIPRLCVPQLKISALVFWTGFGAATAGLLANVLWVYHGNFHLVGFSDVYAVRFAARDIEAGVAGYATFWVGFALSPLVMAYGLVRRRWFLFAIGASAQILIYAMIAMKSVLLSIVILPALYFIFHSHVSKLASRVVWSAAIAVALLTASTYSSAVPSLSAHLGMLLLVRTLGIPGLSTLQYYEFFGQNGFTYWSHVRGLSSLIRYPYPTQLPYVIGNAYYDSPSLSANAHFLATDGLAAAGLPGVIVIAFFCGAVFYLCDVLARRHDPIFVSLCLAGPAMALLNVGLFTTLLTDGLMLTMVVLYLMPTVTAGPLPSHRRSRSLLHPTRSAIGARQPHGLQYRPTHSVVARRSCQ